MLLIVILYEICGIWLVGVIIIMIMNFNYIIFMMFEFYTLAFLYLVLNERSSYERGNASIYLMVFGYVIGFRLIMCNNLVIIGVLLLLLGITKLPVYGLHMWLPKVHVEASMLGSIILAGGVLKLRILYYWNFGVIILLRMVMFYSLINIINIVDGKGFAAYSSVLHMTCCILLGLIIMLLVRYIHIVLSPLIFITVYLRYMTSGSRIYLKSGLMIIILWMVNFRVPFCGGFFAEVYIISYIRTLLLVLILMYMVVGIVIIKSINNNIGDRIIYIPWFVLYIIMI